MNPQDEEFGERFSGLFSSMYGVPDVSLLVSSTPTISSTLAERTLNGGSRGKGIPFSSPLIELRLKRHLESLATKRTESKTQVSNAVAELKQKIAENPPDLGGVFSQKRAEIPEIPRYMQMEKVRNDDLTADARRRRKPHGENSLALVDKYRKRLEEAKRKGIERAQKRYEMQTKHEATDYYKRPVQPKEEQEDPKAEVIARKQKAKELSQKIYEDRVRRSPKKK